MNFEDLFKSLASVDTSAVTEKDDSGYVTTDVDWAGLQEAMARNKPVGRPRCVNQAPRTSTERSRNLRQRIRSDKLRQIAILDFETDPFDAVGKSRIAPFLAVLYSDQFEPIVIWKETVDDFIESVLSSITSLPGSYTIYAHNGGGFDYMFFIHKLRGEVMFKGRAIMSCRVGEHELRDSLHIIPERLAGYKKDSFDYSTLTKSKRNNFRKSIIQYCINDCKYLFEIVSRFVKEFGMKLSIGQAAMTEIKKHYKVATLSEVLDGKLRGVGTDPDDAEAFGRSNGLGFFYGGRVECLAGKGKFVGPYHLYDVNSMYPFVMAYFKHPIGREYYFRDGLPSQYTAFVVLECDNFGAFVSRGSDGETSAISERGVFRTTIHEYQVAKRLGLIADEKIIQCIDCDKFSDFRKFVLPIYTNRQGTKQLLKDMDENDPRYTDTKTQDMFYKFLLNNGYGKFAQNSRRFKEHYITDKNVRPPASWGDHGNFPSIETDNYAIWEKPSDPSTRKFNNVGTGASITGAARSVLLEAIHYARDPIYCDTDSLICRGFDKRAPIKIHNENLGAWKIEKTYSEVVICGKKQYAAKVEGKAAGEKGSEVLKSKGVSGLVYADYLAMLEDEVIQTTNKAPTLTKGGDQFYMERKVRATAPAPAQSFVAHRAARLVA